MNQSTMLFYTLIKQDTSSNVSQTKQCMLNQQHYYYKLITLDIPIHMCQTKHCMEQIINMISDICCGFYKIDKSNVSFHY